MNLDETPTALERSINAAAKLRLELPTNIEMESIPLMKLSSLAEEVHISKHEKYRKTLNLIWDNF